MKFMQFCVSGVILVLLASCSSLTTDKLIDYGAAEVQGSKLEVPPDLTMPETDERYKIPEGDAATSATYSDYRKLSAEQPSGADTVLPELKGIRLERNGTRRWLVVEQSPGKVWSVMKSFWREIGLTILSEDQAAGVMETDWAENRAKLPRSTVRKMIGKVIQSAYSSGERDQYLTRLERGKDGKSTEVYISHRGKKQVFSADKSNSIWQSRPNEPELEAIMLQRLMVRFGASEAQASNAVASNQATIKEQQSLPANTLEQAGAATLREVAEGNVVIIINDAFDKSWRRAGLAIEGAGLGVEDKDREKGIYYLRPVNVQTGWAEKLKFWKKNIDGEGFMVNVKDGSKTCQISVVDHNGASSKVTKQLTEEIYKYIDQ